MNGYDHKTRSCNQRAFCLGMIINGRCPSCGHGEPEMATLSLPPEGWDKFSDAINNPKPPNQALVDLMKRNPPWDELS